MRSLRRIKVLEEAMLGDRDLPMLVFVNTAPGDTWRQQLARAREDGRAIEVIRFGVHTDADTVEEAEAIVARYRASWPYAPVTVYSRADEGKTILAQFAADLPEELRAMQ